MIILISLLAFFAIVGLYVGLVETLGSSNRNMAGRMTRYGMNPAAQESTASASRREFFPTITDFLQRRGYGESLRLALARAAVPLKPSEYAVICALLVIVPTFMAAMAHASPLILFVLGMIGWMLPKSYLKHREGQRLIKFESQLSDALSLMASALRSGYSFLRAMQLVADELSSPISDEFERCVNQTKFGTSTEDALRRLLQRVPSYDLDLVITAVIIQIQSGGNLSEVLENISETIRERAAIKGEIKVLSAEARVSMVMLSILPVAMAFLLSIINPKYMQTLITNPLGRLMAVTAFIFEVLGVIMMKKMVELDI